MSSIHPLCIWIWGLVAFLMSSVRLVYRDVVQALYLGMISRYGKTSPLNSFGITLTFHPMHFLENERWFFVRLSRSIKNLSDCWWRSLCCSLASKVLSICHIFCLWHAICYATCCFTCCTTRLHACFNCSVWRSSGNVRTLQWILFWLLVIFVVCTGQRIEWKSAGYFFPEFLTVAQGNDVPYNLKRLKSWKSIRMIPGLLDETFYRP